MAICITNESVSKIAANPANPVAIPGIMRNGLLLFIRVESKLASITARIPDNDRSPIRLPAFINDMPYVSW